MMKERRNSTMPDDVKKNSVLYPFNKEAIGLSKNNGNFNFGLWFNKFIPLGEDDKFNVCGKNGDKNKAIDFYKETYDKSKNNPLLKKLLNTKHYFQHDAYESYKKKYDVIIITAELVSPLITGIGQPHPCEVGMTFDHTLGIPYIPASSIKGIARFSHTLGLIDKLIKEYPNSIKHDDDDIGEYFDDDAEWTNISAMFGKGGQKDNEGNVGNVGNVIFLDAYPESVPEISVDIMNPHYGAYYNKETPPADYLKLNPIKFLTVTAGTKFIFRVMVRIKSEGLKKLAEDALINTLTEEGVGAKTAVGYGLFKISGRKEPDSIQKLIADKKRAIVLENIENGSEVDKICYRLRIKSDVNEANRIYVDIDKHNKEDILKIAGALRDAWRIAGKWYEKDEPTKKLTPKHMKKVEKIKSILK